MSEVNDLLVEIGTEELPPKALTTLSNAFTQGVQAQLEQLGLKYQTVTSYATPRRLALLIESLDCVQQDREIERRGPAVKAAYDADGNFTKAAEGFARSCSVDVTKLQTQDSLKGPG